MSCLNLKKLLVGGFVLLILLFTSGCSYSKASLGEGGSTDAVTSSNDSLIEHNRNIFKLNLALDRYFFKPVAKAYKAVTPKVVDQGVTNFFHNLGDVSNAVNNLLQLKVDSAVEDTGRILVNSTIGLAGVFDVATDMGMQRHKEDFGQTLAVWGVKPGPYMMLPVFGPSTLRDVTAKFSVDTLLDPTNYTDEALSYFVLEKMDKRADLLSTEDAFKDISDDQYIAVRDAWLQRRTYLINDGKVNEEEQKNLIDELEDLDDE